MSEDPGDNLLDVSGLRKAYPGVQALAGADLHVRRGEVHALVGENGAGKSTLARCVCGLTPPDAGRMILNGRPHAPANKTAAEKSGVRIVMQELNLIPTLTVAENIFLEDMPRRLGWIDYPAMNRAAADLMAGLGLAGVHPDATVGDLGVGRQQMVEIAAALSRDGDLLILDEPTAALTADETALLFEQINRLTTGGAGVIYISHRMEEIRRIADRITILRDGTVVAAGLPSATSMDRIIRAMVGRDLSDRAATGPREPGGTAMTVTGLRAGPAVRDVSFTLRRGEILGFAGLMGSGRTETMRAIFAADRPDAGEIRLFGADRPARIRTPADAVRHGIALLTEDRKTQGLLLGLGVRVNITLNRLRDFATAGWVRPKQENAAVARLVDRLDIRCSGPGQRTVELSGGNQQKVVMARWLCRNCEILIFDEPTRGIDVGAKFEIYRLFAELAAAGRAIIFVSSDLKELLAECDRIAVMSAGRLAAVFDREQFDRDRIMDAALSGYTNTTAGGMSA